MPARTTPTQTTRVPLEHAFPPWGVDVFGSHHADGWRMDPTRHEFLKLVLVQQGAGHLVWGAGARIAIGAGDVVHVPMRSEHRFEDEHERPMTLYVVSVKPEVLAVAALDPALLPAGRLSLDELERARVEATVRRLLFEQSLDHPQAGARVVSLTLRLLAELAKIGRPSLLDDAPHARVARPADTATRMRTYVDELADHFFEATNLDDAAAGLGISRRRFTQLFREVTGTSWLAYVRRLRVDHAKKLLAQTERTVLSIAFECGFEDLSTFYRAFKREVGHSPNQWRSAAEAQRGA